MNLMQRLPVALFVLFLLVGCSGSEETRSADGWSLVATSYRDATNIIFHCHLSHVNSTTELVREGDSCVDAVSWYEGDTVIQDPWKVSREGVSRVNLTLSDLGYGKYTCQVLLGSEMLAVSVQLVPEGASSELIKEEVYRVGDMFGVHCPGHLLTICLTDQCSDVHNHTGNMALLSDRFKFVCIVDDKGVVNITYVLPDYQPIRILQPKTDLISHKEFRAIIPCQAIGHPSPTVEIFKWDEEEEKFVNVTLGSHRLLENHSESYVSYVIEQYAIFIDPGLYQCRAKNIWEERNVTVYLGDTNPNPSKPNNCSKVLNTPTPVYNDTVKVEVRMFSVVQVGDTVGIKCVITLVEKESDPSRVPGVWWFHNDQTIPPSPEWHDTADGRVLTKTRTLENVSVSDAGTYTCRYDVIGTVVKGSSTVLLQVVDEELVSVVSNRSSVGILRVAGPSDNATNISAEFRVHSAITPVIAAYPLQQESVAGYLLQAILLQPQWTEGENDTRVVWVELQPSRLANVSIQLSEERTAVLVLNVSYYTHSALVFFNVTFLPHPPISQPPGEDQTGLLGGLATLMVLLLLAATAVSILAVLSCAYWRQLKHRHLHSKNIHLELVERPEDSLRMKILKEVSSELAAVRLLYRTEDLTVGEKLGEGAFGVVCKGDLLVNGRVIPVAVKSIKDASHLDALEEFVKELKMLQRIGQHKNIISLVGGVIKDGSLHILTEYAAGGRLLSHLHKFRGTGLLWRTKVDYGLQVARGMDYLAQRKCVHCDLAARNVLLMEDGTLKVSDFGLARKLYQELYHKNVTSKTRLPLKWMALESIEAHDFDTQTDVWSFGVLLWEIATLGQTPYPLLSPQELVQRLRKGQRLPRPADCPESLFTVMRSCWLPSADDRPKFAQLVAMLEEIVVGVLPQEYELKDLPLGTNPAPSTCSHSTVYEDSAIVSNDVSLDSSTGGYCSYCQPRSVAGEEVESCSAPTPEQSIKLRPFLQLNKMSARRLDSADSGICRNGESDLGSSSSIAITQSAYSTGQSIAHCCTGHSECSCGVYSSGCTYTNSHSSYGNSFGAWGSGMIVNLPHHQLPGRTFVHPNSVSVRHHYRDHLPSLQSGATESDV